MIGSRLGIRIEQKLLDAAVLVAQLNLQVQDPLADAVEPEMARFDHSGMHRPHGHFVNLFPRNGIVIISPGISSL
jgi:hypothetical protein